MPFSLPTSAAEATPLAPYATLPNLDDPTQFECRRAVPILDTHTRNGRTVDADRLQLVVKNSNARVADGELGLLLIGHTTDDGKETDQPPLAGFTKNYQMGEWKGRACILADHYYRKDKPEAFEYPRRSVEVCYSDKNPDNNFIDAVSLLKRRPARSMGLVTYASDRIVERYAFGADDDEPASESDPTPAPAPAPDSLPLSPVEEPLMPLSPEDLKAIIAGVVEAMKPTPEPVAEPVVDEPVAEPTPNTAGATETERMRTEERSIELVRYEQRIAKAESETKALNTKIEVLERYSRSVAREKDLAQLQHEGFLFDRAEELEIVLDLPTDRYAKHLDRVRKNYTRSVAGEPMVELDASQPNATSVPAKKAAEFTKDDVEGLAKYMKANDLGPEQYSTALERYQADKADKVTR